MIWLIVLLIFLNGYFVAAEFALVRLQAAPKHRFQEGEGLRARVVRRMLADIDVYLSTAQLGITFTSIALGSVGEPYISRHLEAWLGGVVPPELNLAPWVTVALSLALITIVQIIVGEQAPKSYGIKSYELVAGWTAVPMEAIRIAFWPLIWFINVASLGVVRLLGADTKGHTAGMTEEDIRMILAQGRRMGSISERERRIMTNAMKLEDLEARDVMVPRPNVVVIEASAAAADVRALVRQTGHSRIPVVDPDLDHCVGVVFAKDLLDPDVDDKTPVSELMHEPLFVPETISAERLLYLFQTRGTHLAITIDEFGGAAGLVTLEDILEELVGEITDEYDPLPRDVIRPLRDGVWRVSGMAKLEDLEPLLGIEFAGDQDTLSGWFIYEKDDFPRRNDSVEYSGYRFIVEAVEPRRVATLRIERIDAEPVNDEKSRPPTQTEA